MNAYEVLLLLDPDVAEDRQGEIVSRTRELVERAGGAWQGHDAWGRRRLAYEIAHKNEGVYHLLTFDCEPATLGEVSRVLKITDGVLRHLAVRRVQARPEKPLAAVGASGQDAGGREETPEEEEA